MNPEALEALKASIAAWEHKLTIDDPNEINAGASACPLCEMFDPDDDTSDEPCSGCPVREDTGLTGCRGTPYGYARDALILWRNAVRQKITQSIEARKSDWHQLANREIDYLKSLLP